MARAVLAGPPRDAAREQDDYAAALAAMGLVDEQAGEFLGRHEAAPGNEDESSTELWPDTQDAFALFSGMLTQWRMGASGPIGMDYGAMPIVERRMGLSPERAEAAFPDLQVMEAAALEWFAEAAKRRR